MAIREVYTVLRSAVVEGYASVFKDEKAAKSARSTILVLVLAAAAVGGFYLYRYYVSSKESAAQKAFVESVRDFQAAQNGSSSWYDAEVAFEMAYRNNSGSSLAPYFLAYKAKSLQKQGKDKEAVVAFGEALKKMDAKSDIYWIYKTEFAAIKLDMKDDVICKEGLGELEKIACLSAKCKADNAGTASALFYLATHYWENKQPEKAKNLWAKLAGKGFDSPYVQLAKDKLKQ